MKLRLWNAKKKRTKEDKSERSCSHWFLAQLFSRPGPSRHFFRECAFPRSLFVASMNLRDEKLANPTQSFFTFCTPRDLSSLRARISRTNPRLLFRTYTRTRSYLTLLFPNYSVHVLNTFDRITRVVQYYHIYHKFFNK